MFIFWLRKFASKITYLFSKLYKQCKARPLFWVFRTCFETPWTDTLPNRNHKSRALKNRSTQYKHAAQVQVRIHTSLSSMILASMKTWNVCLFSQNLETNINTVHWGSAFWNTLNITQVRHVWLKIWHGFCLFRNWASSLNFYFLGARN